MPRVHQTLIAVVLITATVGAQESVSVWPDRISWATAFVNPTVATVQALKSEQKGCRLARIALSEGLGNGVALTMKHFISSARPCLGCAPDGMTSGHSMNSMIGFSSHWSYGLAFGFTTGGLRMAAHRHTLAQVAAGLAIGAGAEWAGRLVKCAE